MVKKALILAILCTIAHSSFGMDFDDLSTLAQLRLVAEYYGIHEGFVMTALPFLATSYFGCNALKGLYAISEGLLLGECENDLPGTSTGFNLIAALGFGFATCHLYKKYFPPRFMFSCRRNVVRNKIGSDLEHGDNRYANIDINALRSLKETNPLDYMIVVEEYKACRHVLSKIDPEMLNEDTAAVAIKQTGRIANWAMKKFGKKRGT